MLHDILFVSFFGDLSDQRQFMPSNESFKRDLSGIRRFYLVVKISQILPPQQSINQRVKNDLFDQLVTCKRVWASLGLRSMRKRGLEDPAICLV